MLLRHKLSALMALAAAAPTAVAGWSALAIAERSAVRSSEESERQHACATALRIGGEVGRIQDLVHLFASRSFDFSSLDAAALAGAARLIYGLDERITVSSILRVDGSGAAPSFYRRTGNPGNRPEVGAVALGDHAARVPLADALARGQSISAIYRNHDGQARLAIAAVADSDGADVERAVIVVEVAVDELLAGTAPDAEVFDAEGHHAAGRTLLQTTGRTLGPPATWGRGVTVRTADILGSFAPVPNLGWGIVIARPMRTVIAGVRDLERRIVFWALVGAIAALLAGAIFARGITRPLDDLYAAANAFGRGNLDRRVRAVGSDEIGQVGAAFNRMAGELAASHVELRRWNSELERLVQERTAELRNAIEQLLLAHRLAAIGQLGAGVAHEINNPLTYVVGALQLLPTAAPDKRDAMTQQCLASARRIQEVVTGLLQVSQPNGDGKRTAVDADALVDNALLLVAGKLAEAGISVRRDRGAVLPRIYADPSQLTQALVQILTNARDAMPDGGELTVETTGAIGDKLLLVRIADTGRGIAAEHLDRLFDPFFTTRSGSGHRGLGLSLAYRIVKDHGGSILAESQLGAGTRFTLRLPALPKTMSLA